MRTKLVLLCGLILCLPRLLSASTLKDDEQVLLYPAWAKAVKEGWEVQVQGLVYEPERRRVLGAALQRLLRLADHDITPAERQLFAERSRYFMVDDERGKRLTVRLGGHEFPLGKSAPDGHFTARWRWPTNDTAMAALLPKESRCWLTFGVPADGGGQRTLTLEVHPLEEQGWSVISDIDDTIKISQVLDHGALLRNTFCRPFRAVPGMADVYEAWSRQGAQFHYVTASPWQLYEPLAAFVRSNHFPGGTFHMKQFRWKDSSALNLFASPEHYKTAAIEPLLRAFPHRQFVLVGDSGERDPETYGALSRKYPQQIRAIYIRDVTKEPRESRRYERAFADLPPTRWQLFREPAELQTSLAP